jgi:MFS family permease
MLTGEKTWERFIPKYLEGIGSSVIIIGGFGFLLNFLGAFWSLPGGYIADKFGNKKAFLIFNLMAIGGYLIAIIFTNWIAVFVGMLFFSAWNAISLPASMSLIGKSLGANKTAMGISMHSIIRRFPMMIGPIIGGILISKYGLVIGIKLCFGISILLCIAGIFFQQKMTVDKTKDAEKLYPVQLWKKFDPKLKNLLISDILIRFCEQIPYVFVVIWCLDYVKISPEQFGVLTAIEMITAAVIYIPVASFSDRLERKPFIVITFIFFTIFPFFLYFSTNYLMLIFAFIIRGLKEFGEPTRKALILDLSVKNAEARSFGLYYFVRDMIVSLAAFFGGFLWKINPSVNMLTAFAAGIAGTLFFLFWGKGTNRTTITN